ncbi:MAG: peptidylprolyl isomerase [Pseudomonadota bacterium]|nr:peptidylprolyl isomerase [Pseudomonadota bacterium]
MRKLFTLLLGASMLLISAASEAKTVDKVVAVINDNIITQSDLNARFELIMRSLSKNPSRDEQRLLLFRTLNSMIDESLLQQYASNRGFTIQRSDIDLAIARFEQSRNLPRGAYAKITAGVEETAEQQIVSDLVLQQIIDRVLRNRVNIPNSEVDQLIRQLGAANMRTEWEVAQIFIPVGEAEGAEDNAKSLAETAYERASTESDFASVAKDYNTGGTPLDGYLGWFGEGEMVPVLEETVRNLKAGEVSKPVRSGTGYHIVQVKELRSLPGIQTEPVTEYKLKKTSHLEDGTTTEDELWVAAPDLSTQLKNVITKLDVGDTTKKIQNGEDMVTYTLLEKKRALPEGLEEYRERVRNRLMESRLDLAVRRMMRDLRRDAFIDIRL